MIQVSFKFFFVGRHGGCDKHIENIIPVLPDRVQLCAVQKAEIDKATQGSVHSAFYYGYTVSQVRNLTLRWRSQCGDVQR